MPLGQRLACFQSRISFPCLLLQGCFFFPLTLFLFDEDSMCAPVITLALLTLTPSSWGVKGGLVLLCPVSLCSDTHLLTCVHNSKPSKTVYANTDHLTGMQIKHGEFLPSHSVYLVFIRSKNTRSLAQSRSVLHL